MKSNSKNQDLNTDNNQEATMIVKIHFFLWLFPSQFPFINSQRYWISSLISLCSVPHRFSFSRFILLIFSLQWVLNSVLPVTKLTNSAPEMTAISRMKESKEGFAGSWKERRWREMRRRFEMWLLKIG